MPILTAYNPYPKPQRSSLDRLIVMRGDRCTLYAPNALTVLAATSIVVSNAAYVRSLGTTRGDVIKGSLPSTVTPQPGQVISIPTQPDGWFLIVKRLYLTHTLSSNPGNSISMLALPQTLTLTREALADPVTNPVDIYNAPYKNATGAPIDTQSLLTIHVGFNNGLDPLINAPEGDTPTGTVRLYTPLGVPVQQGDRATLLGLPMIVEQTNTLYADGSPYCAMLLFGETSGNDAVPRT